MANPSQAESVEHLSRAMAEMQRLAEHFSQRSKDDKKRMAVLQALVPRLKRLSKAEGVEKAVTADELKVLESLKPAAKKS